MDGIRDGIRERLEQELQTAVSRLRPPDGAVAVEELPGPNGTTCHFADEVDQIQASESRNSSRYSKESPRHPRPRPRNWKHWPE